MSRFSERFIQRGEQQGLRKGEAKVLLRLLQLRFGKVPVAVREEIERANAETLLKWSERVLTASQIEQVIDENS